VQILSNLKNDYEVSWEGYDKNLYWPMLRFYLRIFCKNFKKGKNHDISTTEVISFLIFEVWASIIYGTG
jgi:hypothetical protein